MHCVGLWTCVLGAWEIYGLVVNLSASEGRAWNEEGYREICGSVFNLSASEGRAWMRLRWRPSQLAELIGSESGEGLHLSRISHLGRHGASCQQHKLQQSQHAQISTTHIKHIPTHHKVNPNHAKVSEVSRCQPPTYPSKEIGDATTSIEYQLFGVIDMTQSYFHQ